MILKDKLLCWISPICVLLLVYHILVTDAYMKSVRIDEIPFGLVEKVRNKPTKASSPSSGIYALTNLEQKRSFFHLFNVPYIVCFFAAKGKWPFIPSMMQVRVDAASKTIFSHNDSYIKQFCQKWIQIKECFRPLIVPTTAATVDLEALRVTRACPCSTPASVVYFDKTYIGNVSADTIMNTIEFLQSFLPTATKKSKRKNKVRGRLDEMDID